MEKGKLFVLSGPSGTGKGVICKRLLARKNPISLSISMTTRDPRPNEIEGREYYFTSMENFKDCIENDGLLEYAEVYGNYYGTPKDKVLELINQGKNVLLEIDIDGTMQVKKNYDEAILIFVMPPTMAELEKRIRGRGTETEEKIQLRMKSALNEIDFAKEYDYCVVNDKIDVAVRNVEKIIRAERLKVSDRTLIQIKNFKEEK